MPGFRERRRRDEDAVELVELYFKGDKENENRERILALYAGGRGD